MSTFLLTLVILIPMVFLTASTALFIRSRAMGKPMRKALRTHVIGFVLLVAIMVTLSVSAAAETAGETGSPSGTVQEETASSDRGIVMLSAGLAMGLSGIGAGIAVAAGAPAAIAATSENPKSFAKSMIFVALGEAIAIYGLVISIMIMNG